MNQVWTLKRHMIASLTIRPNLKVSKLGLTGRADLLSSSLSMCLWLIRDHISPAPVTFYECM